MAGTQTRRIIIKVDTAGNRDIQDLANKLGGVTRNTKSLKDNLQALTGAFSGWLAFLGVREISRMSDEMQNLSNRLKLVSRAGEDNVETMGRILQLADETNQSVADVGIVYTRLGAALKSANATTGTMLDITKALINSFRLAGATGNETTSTIIQLSQAFSSGQLRGQELRSVMEQNVELARLLRENFKGDIYKAAEKGLIGITDVLRILRDNQERINTQAKVLAPTFEQTMTKAFNKARFALFELNEQFKLSAKFATGMDALVSRLSLLGAVAGALALTQIPLLIRSLQTLSGAMITLATRNPLVAALLAVSAVVIATNDSLGGFIDRLRNLGAWFIQIKIWALEARFAIDKAFATGLVAVGAGSRGLVESLSRDLEEIKALKEVALDFGTPKYRPSPLDPSIDKKKSDQEFEDLLKRLEKMSTAGEKVKKTKEVLAELNQELLRGAINIGEYNQKILNFQFYKLNKEFAEGKIDLLKYNEGLREVDIQKLNMDINQGQISMTRFRDSIRSIELDALKDKLDAGRMSVREYNNEVLKVSQALNVGGAFQSGTQAYFDSIGTISTNVADAVRNTFTTLEDSMVKFTTTGKFNFQEMAMSILEDLNRIIIRASIVRPLADAILNAGFSAAASSYSGSTTDATGAGYGVYAAKGAAFDRGLKKFAKGGIVDSPTMFGYGGGRRGLMGEAGPEAILPLKRGSGGDLGVSATVTPVTINIVNQSGSEVQQSESFGPNGERTIEILIQGKVREGIASGRFDTVMKQSYGLHRKGS